MLFNRLVPLIPHKHQVILPLGRSRLYDLRNLFRGHAEVNRPVDWRIGNMLLKLILVLDGGADNDVVRVPNLGSGFRVQGSGLSRWWSGQ